MKINKRILLFYFIIFLVAFIAYAGIDLLFQLFAAKLPLADAVRKSAVAGLFFGLFSVAIWLIIKPLKIKPGAK